MIININFDVFESKFLRWNVFLQKNNVFFDTDIKILKKIWLNRKETYLQKNTLLYIQQIISLENFVAKGRIAENFCTV